MPDSPTLVETLLSPPVLLTFIVCAAIAGLIIWLQGAWHRRQRQHLLADQRSYQDATVERLLDSVAEDKDRLIAEYEERLRERDEHIASLEGTVSRLRDRLSSSGLLGLFGGKQRDVVGALLLENEQLHELLAEKQQQMRDVMADLTGQLMDRLDEQTQASARAVRYKQALLSAFLQHEEARAMLDRMIAEGQVKALPKMQPEPQATPEDERAAESAAEPTDGSAAEPE